MGFRSTYITEDYAIEYPDWYKEKYTISSGGVPYSPLETKYPGEFVADTWKVLKEIKWFEEDSDMDFNIVLLHECGGVTKAQMGIDYLIIADPSDWEVYERYTDDPDYIGGQGHHMYCYACSDLREYVEEPKS